MKKYANNCSHFGWARSICIVLAMQFAVIAEASTKPVVIGYLPAFRAMTDAVDKADLTLVTHINISFLNPDANGILIKNDTMVCMPDLAGAATSANTFRYVVNKAQASGVKVLVSVAGGVIPSCSGDWSILLQPSHRQTLIDNLIKFVDDFNLDGLDIDLEGEVLTNIDRAGNYTPFIQSLSEKLKARNKLLTCATASYEGGMIPVSSISYFDFVNIMSYDMIGPSWGTPGVEHSTYAHAVGDVNLWKSRGLSREKLVLGVPFYGYGFGAYAANYTYKDIVANFGTDHSDKDLIGTACAGCSYITYNGISTIKNKTRLALQQGAGVMIWELTQDTPANVSLLKTINTEIQQTSNASSSSLASSSSASSSLNSSSAVTANANQPSKGSGGALGLLDFLLFVFVAGIFVSVGFLKCKSGNAVTHGCKTFSN